MTSARYAAHPLPLLPPREERAGERRVLGRAGLPLSPALSPLLRRGERESAGRRDHVELADLNQEAAGLAKKIQKNFEGLGV
jgi:hypothetical protein